MISCYLQDPNHNVVGVLETDFTFTATETCIVSQVSFYKTVNGVDTHLFRTEFNATRALNKGDTLVVKLDSGINLYYLLTKIKETDLSVETKIRICQGIHDIAEKIKHERQARDQFNTWDPQIYNALFNEK